MNQRRLSLYRLILILIPLFLTPVLCCCHNQGQDPLLQQLDKAISQRKDYITIKQLRLDSLKREYAAARDTSYQFQLLERLFDEYRTYNSDSAMVYCNRILELAPFTGNPWDTIHAKLNVADLYTYGGTYNEVLDILRPISSEDMPNNLRSYFFHLKRTVYGLLEDFSIRPQDKEKYNRLTDLYRDSLLQTIDPNCLTYYVVKGDSLNVHGNPTQAIAQIQDYITDNSIDNHESAIAAYTLSVSYSLLGDHARERDELVRSSISDMETAVKEYVSLRKLAILLYQQGDVKHAYDYLRVCIKDAQECNARQRILEINEVFPVVNDLYLNIIAEEQHRSQIIIGVVCVLSILLLFALYYIYKQMRKVSEARRSELELNKQLTKLNTELQEYNQQLTAANREIAQTSAVKEAYIVRYMDQCIEYIDKLDGYRKSLNMLAVEKNLKEIQRMTKSQDIVDQELKKFYDNFDQTFLKLFPTFVNDFNALLREEERFVIKSQNKLNAELRIFALIRLGINDSVRIAKFLRYSPTTIYNYRTRVRNKAQGDRNALEDQIMHIGLNH